MDKKSILGYVLIFVVVVGWMLYQQSTTEKPVKKPITSQVSKDTLLPDNPIIKQKDSASAISLPDSVKSLGKYGSKFTKFSTGNEKITTVENDVFTAILSNKGGAVKAWTLKKFKKWDKKPTQLIWDTSGELYLTFTSFEGNRIDTRELYFDVPEGTNEYYKISGNDSITFSMKLEAEPGKFIQRKYTFFGNKYAFDNDVIIQNMDEIMPPNRGYNLVWGNGLKYQEINSVEESNEAHALAQMNGNIAEINASDDKPAESKETGVIDFIGMKTKYFGMAIIPKPWQSFDGTADLYGWKKSIKNKGNVERYNVSLRVPFKQGFDEKKFTVYIGPLDYDIVKEYGVQTLVNLGWKYGIRQIAEYFMLPILSFIHKFVSNYGISIIIFSILMKMLLYPLTITQMKSAQKMQLLAPEMAKLREKYKDDNVKQQQAIMGLYSEYGINPAGGCLPMVLQMPILIALWQLLRSAIDLRQAPFAFWITDLSVPDKLVDFGYPILGLTHISGLALAMGITMFFQQKLTITDPRQKSLVYMMPVMFTLMFSYFPSGLNLYYFMFNLLSIGQQVYLNKFSSHRPTLESLRRSPKKEGWLQKKMREAQQLAEAKGGSIPKSNGAGNYNSDKNNAKRTSKPINKKPGKK